MTVESDARMIEQVTRMGDLYELYGRLLTARQQEIMEMYYLDDWSLAEVAEHLGITRQAVHDNVRRAEEQLEGYEDALGLWGTERIRRGHLTQLTLLWQTIREHVPGRERASFEAALNQFMAEWDSPRPGVE